MLAVIATKRAHWFQMKTPILPSEVSKSFKDGRKLSCRECWKGARKGKWPIYGKVKMSQKINERKPATFGQYVCATRRLGCSAHLDLRVKE